MGAEDVESAAVPNLDSQLDPEAGPPTIDGMDGDGIAKSLGEFLGAAPVDGKELTEVTDADDGATTGASATGVGGNGGRMATTSALVTFVTCASAETLTSSPLESDVPALLPIPNNSSILENMALFICAKLMTSIGSTNENIDMSVASLN